MKKNLLTLLVISILVSSCSVTKSMVDSSKVNAEKIPTATIASIEVSPHKCYYKYVPTVNESRQLTESQLVQNAYFEALKENGNADVMISSNYKVQVRQFLIFKKIVAVEVSGYPAYYIDIRDATMEEAEKIDYLRNLDGSSKLKSLFLK